MLSLMFLALNLSISTPLDFTVDSLPGFAYSTPMTNIAADTTKVADDLETEAKSGAEHVREAFDVAKEKLEAVSDDPHADAQETISAFLEHLAKSAETDVKDAAAKLKALFDEIV